jgi:hypothetical protein
MATNGSATFSASLQKVKQNLLSFGRGFRENPKDWLFTSYPSARCADSQLSL